jgi:drug/metabolite transporter (DMT)-like permease
MPPAALALVLIGALIHASWNIVAKKAGGDSRFAFYTAATQAIFWTPFCVWWGWSVVPTWGLLEWGLLAASAALHSLYFQCLLAGYRKSDLTVVYPVARGSGPMLSSVVAIVVFGEQISALGAAGIAGVGLGVFLIAGGPKLVRSLVSGQASRAEDNEGRARIRAGLFWGVLTGTLIASYTVLDAYTIKVIALSPILFDYWCNILRLPLTVGLVLPRPRESWVQFKSQWKPAAFVGVISPVSYVCVLYAMKLAPVSHVAPAREVSMLFAALIGGQLLGESDRGLRVAGAAVMAAGVMALAIG